MAVVKPFICIRPAKENAAKVAALPYDVYNRKEACAAVAGNPISFLNIDRAETQFSDDVDTYADCVYEKARELLDTQIAEGVYVTDAGDHYYLYELTMDGRSQTGIVACSSIDDYVNGVVKKHENTGLTAGPKFLLQLAAAIAFTALLRHFGYLAPHLYIPFANVTVELPWMLYMVFAAFVMVGTVNAVNLTDGVDGLATGVTIPVMLCYVAVSAWYGRTDLVIVSAALAGGLSAFLIYNFHPAKVFMGDTGSLFLGGAVCGLAFALDLPLMIPIVGLIYVLEVLSDIIQVVYFKKTGGKRFFRMAPLHHHLEMGGWSETKLFCVFSGLTLVLCVVAFLGVMNRYPV